MTAKRMLMHPQVLLPKARAPTCYVTGVARVLYALGQTYFCAPTNKNCRI